MPAKVVVALIAATLPLSPWAFEPRHPYTGLQYFKNYALSVCIADGYHAQDVADDANAAANGYFELGTFAIDAHQEAIALAQEFLKREYVSKSSGQPLTLMKCIDFYHSKELDRLARKYRTKQ